MANAYRIGSLVGTAMDGSAQMTSRTPGVCAVTGASGYVGSIIMRELQQHMPVVAMARHPQSEADILWSLESDQGIAKALRARNVKTLVHAAWDMRANSLKEMEKTCVQGSAALFDAAVSAGVERIVFVSSISAFEGCRSAYGKTKLMVEKRLQGSANTIFRFGLVFGDRRAASSAAFGGKCKIAAYCDDRERALPAISAARKNTGGIYPARR